MRSARLFTAAMVCTAAVSLAHGQQIAPSDTDVNGAIATGLKDKGRNHALDLQDSGKSFMAAMSRLDTSGNSAPSSAGFSLQIYTPISWIEQQAANAAKEYRSFAASDVTDDMRESVLRVIVNPDTPTQVTAEGMRGTQSVSHVVLRDESKAIVVQPTFKEPFTKEVSNAMGGKAVYQGVLVKFPLDAVKELRGKNGDREFFVTVIGDNKERDFKVKKKHFERLP
jgi:hypothetical protein